MTSLWVLLCLSGVPLKSGYSEERVRLPRRDAAGSMVGEIEALVMRRE